MKGLFISFEGNEGSGKTTQVKYLENLLKTGGYSVVSVREPGGTPLGEELRVLLKHRLETKICPKSELLLMEASRAQLVQEVIQPSLDQGKIVLCDRFMDSSLFYQGYGRGMGKDVVDQMNRFAVERAIPDVTFLIRVPVKVAQERLSLRTGSVARFELEGSEFFQAVERGMDELEKEQCSRVRRIDGDREIGVVTNDLLGQILDYIKSNNLELERFKHVG